MALDPRRLSSDDESEYLDSDRDSQLAGDDRPNRFHGHPKTYERYIEQERAIFKHVEQTAASDLSIHLYNAFALRKRLYLPSSTTDAKWPSYKSTQRWIDPGKINQWQPSRVWFAWPLEVARVPALQEEFGVNATDDAGTLRHPNVPTSHVPWHDLSDVLFARSLEIAKTRWNLHTLDSGNEPAIGSDPSHSPMIESDTDAATDSSSRPIGHSRTSSTSGQKSIKAEHLSAPTVHDSSDEEVVEGDQIKLKENAANSGKRRLSRRGAAAAQKPILSADDDKSRQLLRPSIEGVIAKLDSLFLALAQSQNGHLYRTTGDYQNDPGLETSDASDTGGQRAPPTKADTIYASIENRPKSQHSTSDSQDANSFARRGKGRPAVYGKPLPGETYYYFRKRVAEEARLANPDGFEEFGTDPGLKSRGKKSQSRSQTGTPKRKRSTSIPSGGESSGEERIVRSGLRDWSEILGMAALVGWDEAALDRAAQRCSTLFGEGMAMRQMGANADYITEKPSLPILFTPETIPPLDNDLSALDDADDTTQSLGVATAEKHVIKPTDLACPHASCPRSSNPYDSNWRLVEHIKRKHGYNPRNVEKTAEPDMLGGIHRDGFLLPIPKHRGWRDGGSGARKKGKGKGRGMGSGTEEDVKVKVQTDDSDSE